MADILAAASPKSDALLVSFYGLDQYQSSFTLQGAMQDGVFLAYEVNEQPLPIEHGYPLRLVARGYYGGEWVKWLHRITVQ